MPLGVEVKVMQCFRCKAYGHRTGDRECPLANQGNFLLDTERQAREDPMAKFVASRSKEREEKYARVEELKLIVEQIRKEERDRKKRKSDKRDLKRSKKTHKSDKSHKKKRAKTE
jgi:retinitis pigmentosa 9 protein